MADFNAGSIEGTLDVDTSPFVRGLQLARQQASEFEHSTYTATLKTKYETSGDKPGDAVPTDTETTSTVKADDTQFDTTLTKDEARLAAFDRRKATAKVDVDTSKAGAAIRALDRNVDKIAGFYKKSGGIPGGGSGHGLAYLVGLAAALAPALAPAIPAIALFGTAAVAAFGGAAVSLALYAGVAHGAFTTLTEAIKAGKDLPGAAGAAETALKGLTKAWENLHKAVDPLIFQLMSTVFTQLTGVIPKLAPLINAMSKGLIGAFQPIAKLLNSGLFQKFLNLLSANALKDLPMLGQAISHMLSGLMSLFIALNPVIQQSLRWFVGITQEFQKWARVEAPGFIKEVFGQVKKEGPPLLHMLGALLSGVFNIAKGFGPLVGPATTFLTALGNALGKINLAPLAKGVGDVLVALSPFLDIVAQLVNVLLPPLGALLSTLADTFITPLANSLAAVLVPAFQGLADILDFAQPYIAAILASFADLLNPTGVGVLAKVFAALGPVVRALIPPLTGVILAIEGLVDQLLTALVPAIAPVGAALVDFVNFLTPAINSLSWFIDHPEVAVAIGAIALAIKGLAAGAAALKAVMTLNATLTAALGIGLGPVLLIVAAVIALGVAFYEAYKHSAQFREAIKGIGQWIVGTLYPALKQFGDYLMEHAVPALIETAKSVGHSLLPVLKQLASTAKGLWPSIKQLGDAFVVNVWPAIKKVVPIVAGLYLEFIKLYAALDGKVLQILIVVAGFIVKTLIVALTGFFEMIGNIIEQAKDMYAASVAIAGFFSDVGKAVGAFPGAVKDWFKGAGHWLVEHGRDIVGGLWRGIKAVWENVNSWLGERKDRITSFFTNAIKWLQQAGTHVLLGLLVGFREKYIDVSSWLGDRKARILDHFTNAVDWLKDKGLAIIRGLFSGITEKWAEVNTWLGKVGSAALTALGDLSAVLKNAGLSLMQGFWDGLKQRWEDVKNWLSNLPIPGGLGGRVAAGAAAAGVPGIPDAFHHQPTPRLAISGGAAARQAAAMADLNERFSGMVGTLVGALDAVGSTTKASDEATRAALVDALDGLGTRVETSDRNSVILQRTIIRKN